MSEWNEPAVPVADIDAPRDPGLQQLYQYWISKRGDRAMPSRADINPSEIKPLLPDMIILSAAEPYVYRLIGDNVVRFVGENNTGRPASYSMREEAGRTMNGVLASIVAKKAPRFRLGRAFWKPDKAYRDFESCFLPLSADGENVDMILGGLKILV